MKILKKSKKKKWILIIINILVLTVAGFFVYQHFFGTSLFKNDSGSQQEKTEAKVLVFIGDYITSFGAEQATINNIKETYPNDNFTSVNLAGGFVTSQQISDSLNDELIENLSQLQIDTIFISIGATDANNSIPADTYSKNINEILEKLAILNNRIIINCPPYIDSENKSADNLLLTYCQSLGEIEKDNVHFGDESVYSVFKDTNNALLSSEGIYPNDAGYKKLGEIWANIYKAVSGD